MAHRRTCQTCGADYETPRADSKFCSGACRAKASRQHPRTVTPLVAVPDSAGPIESAVLRELREARAEQTSNGQTALAMARRIDAGDEAGAAAASWARQMNDSLDRALRSSTAKSRLADLRASRPA